MQLSIGRPDMLRSNQRGRGQEPVIVQGNTGGPRYLYLCAEERQAK